MYPGMGGWMDGPVDGDGKLFILSNPSNFQNPEPSKPRIEPSNPTRAPARLASSKPSSPESIVEIKRSATQLYHGTGSQWKTPRLKLETVALDGLLETVEMLIVVDVEKLGRLREESG